MRSKCSAQNIPENMHPFNSVAGGREGLTNPVVARGPCDLMSAIIALELAELQLSRMLFP